MKKTFLWIIIAAPLALLLMFEWNTCPTQLFLAVFGIEPTGVFHVKKQFQYAFFLDV